MGMNDSDGDTCCFCKAQHINAYDVTSIVIKHIKVIFLEKSLPKPSVVEVIVSIRRAVPVHAIQLHVRKSIDDLIVIRELPTQIGNIRFYAAFVQAKSDHKNFHYFISVIAF